MSEKRRDERTCDLCGRRLRDKYGRPYAYAIWCLRCLRAHAIYPDECVTCGGYHFAPGVTAIDSPEHIARMVQNEADKVRHDKRMKELIAEWEAGAAEREATATAARIRASAASTDAAKRIRERFLKK